MSIPVAAARASWLLRLPAIAAVGALALATAITGANGFGIRLVEALVDPSTTAVAGVFGVAVAAASVMLVAATR